MNIKIAAIQWILHQPLKEHITLERKRSWAVCTIAGKRHYIRKSYVEAATEDVVRVAYIAGARVEGIEQTGEWTTVELRTWSEESLDNLLQELEPGFDLTLFQLRRELEP